jgi:hypothetical protein
MLHVAKILATTSENNRYRVNFVLICPKGRYQPTAEGHFEMA